MFKRISYFLRKKFLTPEEYGRFLGVKIGKNCRIQSRHFGSEPYLITIGNNVRVTENVKFFTHGGAAVLRKKYPKFDFFGKIRIGNNVYIGNSTIILPGVRIGDDVLIGAGSVVTKSIPNGKMVGGNPARIIGDVDTFEDKYAHMNLNTKGMDADEKKKFLLSLPEDKFISR